MEKEEKPKKIEIPENTADLFTDEELQSFVRFFKILLEIDKEAKRKKEVDGEQS